MCNFNQTNPNSAHINRTYEGKIEHKNSRHT
ncbi:hypothetical protein T08_6984 [Trichinella sp. T8]|nr:hypothetical protein T08_6984 [Trichinella sp. T8]